MTNPNPAAHDDRPIGTAMLNGLKCRCPACGEGRMFSSYLKVAPNCNACGEALYHHQADDAPPYFTIFIVGHLVVPPMLWMELQVFPPIWVHLAIWPLLTLVLALGFLQPIKGAVVAWQWAHKMHGFDPNSPEARLAPDQLPGAAAP